MSGRALTTIDSLPDVSLDRPRVRQPDHGWLRSGFLRCFDELVAQSGAERAFEVGCGAGDRVLRMIDQGLTASGVDRHHDAVQSARSKAYDAGIHARFETEEITALDPLERAAPLIVACDVLATESDPHETLARLARMARPWLILSVPNQPLWRTLNVAGFRNLEDLGNSPGHIHHWSSLGFETLVRRHAGIVAMRHPLPWTMILARTDQ